MTVHQLHAARAKAANLIDRQMFSRSVRDMSERHKTLELAWRRFAMVVAPAGAINLIAVAFGGGPIHALCALATSVMIVFAARKARVSQHIVAACALFSAVTEGDEA